MGLMLSVLVFCVGVAEVLDCWHHFLLYLVQPQYNPLPYSLDPRKDVLCEQELSPSPDSRRPSHVDISWPKDLSPTDDLHVIKKRPHNENERIFDGVGDCCSPQVVVCGPEPEDPHCTTGSWNTSPNHLELSVISESDSSSEIDEPSLVENLSYNKACCDTSSSAKDKLEKQLSHGQSTVMRSSNDLELETERGVPCSSPSALEHSTTISSYVEENGSVTVSSELPVFTDNILSSNVHKVSSRYSSDTSSYSPLCIDQTVSEEPANYDFTDYNTSTPLSNYERTSSENQSITSILDEGLDPIPEFPEIRLMESSPTPPEESSESSLNTSDASWMARGKTSDRPLIVRFYPSLEQIKKEFESVTKTDLQAFGNNTKHDDNESSVVQQEEVFKNNDVQEKVSKSEGYIDAFPQDFRQQQESKIPRSNILNDPEVNLDRVIDEKKCSLQHDTNSSSSSLSGIPQLPEDPKDTATRASLPTDNGYGSEYNGREENSRDVSNTENNEDNEFSVTSDKSEPEQINLVDLGNVLEGTSERCQSLRSELQLLDTKTLNESINPQHSDNDLQQLQNNPPNSRSSIEGTHVEIVKENEVNTKDPNIYNISLQDPFKVPLEENNKYKNKGLNELKDAEISQDDTKNDTDISESISKDSNLGSCVEEKHISHGKGQSTKNRRPKRSARDISKNNPGSETPVVLCQAKESDEEDHVDSHAQTSCVRSSPLLNEENICEREASSKLEPSTSSTSQKEAIPSTSKAETPENKAFWLIFSGEYTKAMNKDWHSGHFCCWQCDESLTGQRYVLRDEHPYCVKCYESIFANGCEECNKTIGIDSKDLSFKDKHWHEACFLCNKCRVSLVDKQFGSKLEKIFCGNCYDAQFASRCDSCGQIFKAGTKKMEYKTRQWHEPCFACCVCKSPIGTKSFIPREQEIYCAPCYEEKFATRCVKCNKIITSGGVTYKNEPWHRQCFTCTNCSTSLAGQRFTSREEKPYCGPCFGELFAKRCTACTKPITGIGGTRFISFEDRHWHNDCFICGSCQTSLVGRGFLTEGDDLICPECAKQKLM